MRRKGPGFGRNARAWIAGGAAGLAVGIIGLVLAVVRPDVLERGELWTYDLRVRSAAKGRKPHANIVLVKVSEQDIASVEDNMSISWPWPRALFGYITAYCKRAGARVIAFDWLFQDRGQYSVGDAEELATALHEAGNTVIGLALTSSEVVEQRRGGTWAARLPDLPSHDEAVAAALRLQAFNARTFVVGNSVWYGGVATREDLENLWKRLLRPENARDIVAPDAGDAEPAPPPMAQLTPQQLAAEVSVAKILEEKQGVPGDGPVPSRDGIDPPLGVIAVAPARLGHVHQASDVDGLMRAHAPLMKHAGRLFPSLSLAMYLVAHPGTTYGLDGHTLVVGNTRIGLDDHGRFPIRFLSAGSYRSVSAYEILRSQALLDEGKPPTVKDEDLKDAYVIVAPTAHGLRDLRATPMSEVQLGAEVNANVLDNLEEGKWIARVSPWTDGLLALLLCLISAAAMTALSRAFKRVLVGLPLMQLASAGIIFAYVTLAQWLLARHDTWVAVATPAGASALASFVTLVVLSGVERQSRRFVQEALGRYTSPALVQELIDHPEYLSLEWGEERQMSVYFSDIAGFTTISEKLSAKQLVTLLNEYLTEMTDLVLSHGGVVDKYIGDAVMAFWGAPLPDREHAKHAVACAIAMRKRCDELRASWQERFGQAVYARAGVNSGTAVVGNMGSKHKYNYTVMGDMVNLAARLEGANKPYGTYLMISEMTLAELGDTVDVRELDLVAVKGKSAPVTVYEVLDHKGTTAPTVIEAARRFEEGLAHYRARRFDDAKAIFQTANNDPASNMYVERCEYFEANPPPADWDGVWHMKEK
jgi:adenylate cyclase